MKKKIDLLQGNVSETFLQYLIPSVSATMMISFNYFIDTLCIGQKLGEQGLAALNLSWPVTTVLYSVGLLLGTGGGAMFSAYVANGKKEKAKSVFTEAAVTLLLIAAVITILGMVFLKPIVTVLGGAGELRQGVTDYVKWVLIFSVSYMGECFFTSFLRNDNAPKLAMAGTLLSCSLNIILDIVFIYVLDGGMVGASLATSLAVTSTVVLGIFSTFRKKSNLKVSFTYASVRDVLCIMKVGMSTFLTEIDGGIVTFVYNTVLIRIAGSAATTVIAVYGIVVNINTIVLAAINGISNAMQPLVSANSGAGKFSRAKRFTHLAVKWAFGMSVVFVAVIEWQAEVFVKIFLEPDAAFLVQAAGAIRIVAVSYLLAAVNMILISYFQSIQASKEAIYFSFMRTLFLPVIFVIGGAFYLNVKGVWMASLFIEGTTVVVMLFAYRRYQKKRMEENLGQLNFYEFTEEVDGIEELIEQLGADNLENYRRVLAYCGSRNRDEEGIPMIIGLDDLTAPDQEAFEVSAQEDELSFYQAVGALLFTDLLDQQMVKEGGTGRGAIIPAMEAAAERFFQYKKPAGAETGGSISYTEALGRMEREHEQQF